MNGVRRVPFVLSILLIGGISVSSINASNATLSDTLLIGAAGAAVISGACLLGSWLFGSSDKEVLADAREAHKKSEKFSVLCDYVIHHAQAREEDLFCIAQLHITQSMQDYLKEMNKVYNQVKKNIQKINKRMRKLDYSSDLYQDMQEVMQKLEWDFERLQTTYNYLNPHIIYFSLYEIERSLTCYYSKILTAYKAWSKHELDEAGYTRVVRSAVMRYGTDTKSRYPYLDFVDMLSIKKGKLDACLHKLPQYTYPAREAGGTALSFALDEIKNMIMADPEYARSLRDREHDRLEWEKLHAQQILQEQNQQLIAQLAWQQAQPSYALEYEVINPSYEYTYDIVKPTIDVDYELSFEED